MYDAITVAYLDVEVREQDEGRRQMAYCLCRNPTSCLERNCKFVEAIQINVILALLEIAPEVTGQGVPLRKCEAYDRVYDQHLGSR